MLDFAVTPLAQVLASLVQRYFDSRTGPATRGEPSEPRAEGSQVIAVELIKQAYAAGIDLDEVEADVRPLTGGNTADAVVTVSPKLAFVFKMDSDEKLAAEAHTLLRLRSRRDLPSSFRDRFPRVYAIKDDGPPYAYLMEYIGPDRGFEPLSAILYPSTDVPTSVASRLPQVFHALLDSLFAAYGQSINPRLRPDVRIDYVLRIGTRMDEAAAAGPPFASRPIEIVRNGSSFTYLGWQEYVGAIERQPEVVRQIEPPFSTFVHGDPHPENILVALASGTPEMRFIDVKEWESGDYLFDIAKLVHYLLATGPIESGGLRGAPTFSGGPDPMIRYDLHVPEWTSSIVSLIEDRTRTFASRNGDAGWRERYELGMAANLLGLPAGRARKGQVQAALCLYAEGLAWLDRFCRTTRLLDP